MTTYTVVCHTCNDTWRLAGTWSAYESEAAESRPCPHCDAYTLGCPEPTAEATPRKRAVWPKSGRRTPVFAELAARAG